MVNAECECCGAYYNKELLGNDPGDTHFVQVILS